MVVAEHYSRGIEVEICWGYCLLPGLQGGHGVVAELVCESAYGIRRVVEGHGRVIIVVVWEYVRSVRSLMKRGSIACWSLTCVSIHRSRGKIVVPLNHGLGQ